jgi:hypothetical protein
MSDHRLRHDGVRHPVVHAHAGAKQHRARATEVAASGLGAGCRGACPTPLHPQTTVQRNFGT